MSTLNTLCFETDRPVPYRYREPDSGTDLFLDLPELSLESSPQALVGTAGTNTGFPVRLIPLSLTAKIDMDHGFSLLMVRPGREIVYALFCGHSRESGIMHSHPAKG